MDRVGAADARRVDEAVDAQVALGRRARADGDRLVRHPDVARGAIAFGIHRHRCEAHVAARANDAHRDLPAVGDQNLAQNHAILAFGVGQPGTYPRRYRVKEALLNTTKCTRLRPGQLRDERDLPPLPKPLRGRCRCSLGRAARRWSRLVAPKPQSGEGGRSFGRWVLWILGVVVDCPDDGATYRCS